MEFKISHGTSVPVSERELAINLVKEEGIWTFYTNIPREAQRYEDLVEASDFVRSEKVYDENKNLIELSGVLKENVKVNIREKISRPVSEERRKELSEQLARGREKKKQK